MAIFGAGIPLISELTLIGETAIAALLILSFILARKHKGLFHHYLMLVAFLADVLIFKIIMITRAFNGELGSFPWGEIVILPHLIISVAVSAVGAVAIINGFKFVLRKNKKMFMPPKGKMHKLLGRIFLISWFVAYLFGIIVFGRLYFGIF